MMTPTDALLSDYTIHAETLALLPAKAFEYDTLALEASTTYKIKHTPMQLIKHACLTYGWTTYAGRVQAVRSHTRFRNKVPVPLTPDVVLFPTASVHHFDTLWLNYPQIAEIDAMARTMTHVTFKHGKTLEVPISSHSLKQQMQRALEVMYRFQHERTKW